MPCQVLRIAPPHDGHAAPLCEAHTGQGCRGVPTNYCVPIFASFSYDCLYITVFPMVVLRFAHSASL